MYVMQTYPVMLIVGGGAVGFGAFWGRWMMRNPDLQFDREKRADATFLPTVVTHMAYTHTYAHTNTYAHIRAHTRTYAHIRVHTRTYTHIHAHIARRQQCDILTFMCVLMRV